MKALSYQDERGRGGGGLWYCKSDRTELSTNSNVNCTGLHNLRLMRKQQQIKSPGFKLAGFALQGCFSLKRHQKQRFNDL